MNKTLRKLDSKWGMTLVICLTVVVASVATATAGTLINGKNIKKGTVASKQIKNGTIVKADLSKKLSVVGPQGPQGSPGAPGATSVIARREFETTANDTQSQAWAECNAGEHLVGGGAGWAVPGTNQYDYSITTHLQNSVPAGSDGKPVQDGQVATGWRASGTNHIGVTRDFVVVALCATP